MLLQVQRIAAVILLLYQRIQQGLGKCSDFESFEKLVQVCVCEAGREVLDIVFQAVDARLMSERGSNLRVVGFRERTIVTIK